MTGFLLFRKKRLLLEGAVPTIRANWNKPGLETSPKKTSPKKRKRGAFEKRNRKAVSIRVLIKGDE